MGRGKAQARQGAPSNIDPSSLNASNISAATGFNTSSINGYTSLDGLDESDLPQDPFLPGPLGDEPLPGPVFLDTEACLCALQPTPNSNEAAWQCIGNSTGIALDVYNATSGKWFNPVSPGNFVANQAMNDGSNPPANNTPLAYDAGSQSLVALPSQNSLSVYDNACTGVNNSLFSTAFYNAVNEELQGTTEFDAAPCFRPGAFPIQIQNLSSWQTLGCLEGFFCHNNTINSLPQYCPPIDACQALRLAGKVCALDGTNIGMGPFEPVICQAGHYCPLSAGGKLMLPCPKGSYCQPGCATPTPCSFGSSCPTGATFEVFVIPIVLVILIDIAIIIGVLLLHLRKAKRRRGGGGGGGGGGAGRRRPLMKPAPGTKTIATGRSGYAVLDDETTLEGGEHDHDQEMEMVPMMEPTFQPAPLARQGTWSGFQAALEVERMSSSNRVQVESELSPELRSFIDSMRKATDAAHFGLSFQYSELSFQPKSSPRPILQNVTGSIQRGTLVAVMGGSGAGKSTFVNVLMGKTSNTGGIVMVNNVPGKIARYKKLIGYVPQDDVVLPELTVYENIVHSAKVRLPRTWADAEIEAHVTAVIDCLELSHVRDSLVGSVGKPTISGGQRKRVSIGMELAAAPMAIFLDEPTSGLDATSASSLMRTLKAIARLGISVITIIHQPRMEIFEMLDDLILLANGQIIYEGAGDEVQPFFEAVGFHFPAHCNYGDVVTDIITGNGRTYKRTGDISKEALVAHWAATRETHAAPRAAKTASVMSAVSSQSMHRLLRQRGAPRAKQFALCVRRAMLQQYRTKSSFFAEMGLAALAGFLLGLAQNSRKGVLFTGLYQPPFDVLSIASDYTSSPELALLVAIAIGLVAASPGVKVFSEEMLLQRREAEAGHSRLAYFAAKVVSVFPRMLLGCLHFSTLLLLLAVPVIAWGTAFAANLLYFYCVYGLASCVSMVVRREDAPLFATMLSLIVGILSGAAPPLSSVQKWHLEWLWRASPGVWLAEIYFGQMIEPFGYLYQIDLATLATGFHLGWLYQNLLVLFGIGTVYRIIAYGGLFVGKRLRT